MVVGLLMHVFVGEFPFTNLSFIDWSYIFISKTYCCLLATYICSVAAGWINNHFLSIVKTGQGDEMLQVISSLKSAGPHAIQGKQGKVKTPLTNQAISHLAVLASVTHSGQKRAEFTSLRKLLCCYKITLPPISTQTHM